MSIEYKGYNIGLLKPEHSNSFFKLIDSNRVRLEEYFAGTVSKTRTLEDTVEYCKVIEQKILEKNYFPFIINGNHNDSFIGIIDVKNIDWNVPKAEIGYFIDVHYEGNGVISGALGCVIGYLVKTYKFKKLLCRANRKNQGSINVALKNGFELEGTIRNDYKTTNGDIVDLDYYGRVF